MSHSVVCRYHYRGKFRLWLYSVTVWLFSRDGVAKTPCKCGSGAEIYTVHRERNWKLYPQLQGNRKRGINKKLPFMRVRTAKAVPSKRNVSVKRRRTEHRWKKESNDWMYPNILYLKEQRWKKRFPQRKESCSGSTVPSRRKVYSQWSKRIWISAAFWPEEK